MHLFVDHPPISLRRRQNFPLRQEEGAAPAVKSKVRPGMPNWSFSAAERTTSTWKPHLSMVFFWVICLASLILMVLVSPVFCWNCVNIYLYIHTFSVRLKQCLMMNATYVKIRGMTPICEAKNRGGGVHFTHRTESMAIQIIGPTKTPYRWSRVSFTSRSDLPLTLLVRPDTADVQAQQWRGRKFVWRCYDTQTCFEKSPKSSKISSKILSEVGFRPQNILKVNIWKKLNVQQKSVNIGMNVWHLD